MTHASAMQKALIIFALAILISCCATKPSRNMNDMPFDQLIIELSKPIPDRSYRLPMTGDGVHP